MHTTHWVLACCCEAHAGSLISLQANKWSTHAATCPLPTFLVLALTLLSALALQLACSAAVSCYTFSCCSQMRHAKHSRVHQVCLRNALGVVPHPVRACYLLHKSPVRHRDAPAASQDANTTSAPQRKTQHSILQKCCWGCSCYSCCAHGCTCVLSCCLLPGCLRPKPAPPARLSSRASRALTVRRRLMAAGRTGGR